MGLIASLFVKIGADTKDLQKGLKDTKSKLGDVTKGVMGSVLGFATFSGAILAAGKALKDTINDTVAYAEEVRQLSRTIGATPEDASKLIQAADDVKISFNTMQTAMQIAIRNGLDPTIDGMGRLADQYVAIEDPIARSKFLLDTFGRSGGEMAALMEIGADGIKELGAAAEETGLVLNEEAIKATRDYEIAVDNLQDKLNGMAISIGLKVIPSITNLTNALGKSTIGTDLLAETLAGAVDDTTEVILVATQMSLAWKALNKDVITFSDYLGYLDNSFFSTEYDAESLTADIQNLNAFMGNSPAVFTEAAIAVEDVKKSFYTSDSVLAIYEAAIAGIETQYHEAADAVRTDLVSAIGELEGAQKSWKESVGGDIVGTFLQLAEDAGLTTDEIINRLELVDDTFGTQKAYEFELNLKTDDLASLLLSDPAAFAAEGQKLTEFFMPLDGSVKNSQDEVDVLQQKLNDLERTYYANVKIVTNGGYNSNAYGGITVPGNPTPYADGGYFSAGQDMMVGEEGPERVSFNQSGYVTPTDKLGGSDEVVRLLQQIATNKGIDESRLARVIRDAMLQVMG